MAKKKTTRSSQSKSTTRRRRASSRRQSSPSPWGRLTEWMRRNRTALAGLGVLSVVILVAVAWANLEKKGTEETQMKQWSSPPAMSLDLQKQYYATIKTEKGDIRIQLFADKAPVTVNNFVFLARQHFYDNTTFHRVIPGFVAQGGDPTGTGAGGPGYSFADEFHPDLRHDSAGIISMANSGANTNGSQFFITYAPEPHLDDVHTVFGKVVSGMDVLNALTPRNPQDNPTFAGDRIITIEIEEVS
jgi:cyclophilin family peptidyl-prolyl cis-trans isomerase